MRWLIAVLVFLSSAQAKVIDSKGPCVGPSEASNFYVYLNGSHLTAGYGYDFQTRKVLTEVGEKLNVRFALPQANMTCDWDKERTCWTDGKEHDRQTYAVRDIIQAAAKQCFGDSKFGLVGFSNGGNFVESLMRSCAASDYSQLIAVGGGNLRKVLSDPASLSSCQPKLLMVIGDKDAGAEATKKAFKTLQDLQAPVEMQTYHGGHVLLAEPLEKAIESGG
jgi:predicted esterase